METIIIGKSKSDLLSADETMPEIIHAPGKIQNRRILRKENNLPFKRSQRPVIRIKYHSKVKFDPPPDKEETAEYAPREENCQYFAIMNIGRGFEYGATARKGREVWYYIPNIKLSVPGLYRFEIPDVEKYEIYGKLKIYRVRIIESMGM